jgi:FkbM family methyltransferase
MIAAAMLKRVQERLNRRLRGLRARPTFLPLGRFAVAVARDGRVFHVLAEDLSVTPTLALYGEWEPHVEALLRQILRPGQRVVEAGANVGYHTVGMAASIGRAGRLDSFEPVPELRRLIELNLLANGVLDRVILHAEALLDRDGAIAMLQDPWMAGSAHLAIEHADGRYARRIDAIATTLDTALAGDGGRPVDLIRLDIEGTEMLALRGAQAVLARSPRLRLVFEWSPIMLAARCDPAREAAWLAEQGFRFWRIARGGRPWRRFALAPVDATALPQLPHGELLASRDDP